MAANLLDLPLSARPDPDEFVRAAMEWHFNPGTGSAYWLRRAEALSFDPRADVKGVEDLALFPNIVDELRNIRVEDLIPRGYGQDPGIVGVYESGGTTGAPKRVVVLRDWCEQRGAWMNACLDAHGFPRNVNWLAAAPGGPHLISQMGPQTVADRGGINFSIDMDPRWVKKLIAGGKADDADAYAEHLVEQAAFLLRTQDIGVLITTPPLLERIARHDDLVGLMNEKIQGIIWSGTHMDADTSSLYRTEVFPGVKLFGTYGSTMILGGANERAEGTADDRCVFDPPAPVITFRVVDPVSGRPVGYGERGQVVMNHVSKSMLLPNNLERDLATRVEPPPGQAGDSVADVSPVASFGGEDVIEGVY
ncbi:MAG TPA: phenazine antibiotic biosynthesis protein [Trebonia sp.]|nr:phenazine antibiotic biosynthesis protein [Trebonia sp.]